MSLKTYLSALSKDDRDAFAARCKTTAGHLRNVMYGYKPCSPELASRVEAESKGAALRKELRPDDWRDIWPELAKRKVKETA
jgi:DNA-binding transcriptional regulator YdaS (Cro superfamily)